MREKTTARGGRSPRAHARTTETNRFRLDVVLHFELCNDIATTLSKFYPDLTGTRRDTKRKSIYRWRSAKEDLQAKCATVRSSSLRRYRKPGMGTTLPQDAEEYIVSWVNALRKDGVPVSAIMLRMKALDVAAELGISPDVFKASWEWRKSFLKRHSLSFRARTRQGQVTPEDAQAQVEAFAREVQQTMESKNISKVYNADQTAVFFEYLPKKTITGRGCKTVWVRCAGKEKERVTAMLLGDSDGNKYAPFVIVKCQPSAVPETAVENTVKRNGFGIRLWRTMRELQDECGLQLYANSRGWWNENMSLRFLNYHFGERTSESDPVLLLLDDFSAHWTDKVVQKAKELNVVMLRVPAGCTAVCQPADISWNRPLKQRLRLKWMAHIQEELRAHTPSEPFRMKAPTRDTVFRWLSDAWAQLTRSVIASGFSRLLRAVTANEPEVPPVDCNAIVAILEELRVLDPEVGQVADDDDVVDAIVQEEDECHTSCARARQE